MARVGTYLNFKRNTEEDNLNNENMLMYEDAGKCFIKILFDY